MAVGLHPIISGETARKRFFSYDGLSRLLTALNPETGTACYGTMTTDANNNPVCKEGYDLNGNLLIKTDARSVVTTYQYDDLDRLVSKFAASAQNGGKGLSSCYLYDSNGSSKPTNGVGRLAAEWTQSSTCGNTGAVPSGALTSKTITGYDPVGRVATEQTCVGASCISRLQNYTYDAAGHLSTFGDGVGKQTFTQYFDTAGRFKSLSSSLDDATHSSSLFDIITNSPQGWTTSTMGGVMSLKRTYDSRQRLSTHVVTAGVQ